MAQLWVCGVRCSFGFVIMFIFFFQAEDGIRDVAVTGVQTCALPIYIVKLPAVLVLSPPKSKTATDGSPVAVSLKIIQPDRKSVV